MQIDIKGKIHEKKLAYSNTLLPLFEAIINSIQAIEEDSSTKTGIIEIDIIRSTQKELELTENQILPEIIDFVIKDNGIGFSENNYDSFNYAHSTYKYTKGGKGIGRFIWLRAFRKAEIESRYQENGQWNLRKFQFEPTKKGIENHSLDQVNTTEERYTIVALRGLKTDYRKWCNNNPEDIALKIIEHAFVYFLSENCPRILINDLEKTIVVNDLFNLFTKGQVKSKKIKVRNNIFDLSIVKLYSNKVDNKIHYCANAREVTFDKISIDIPEMDNFLYDKEDNPFSISVYVEGDFLDENVNDERATISFSKGEVEFPDDTSQEELRKAITTIIQSEFEDQIDKLSKTRFTKVKEFVSQHPRYKQLLKYKPNQIKKVPSTLSEEKMELELFKIQQELELEVKKEANQILRFIDNEEEKENFSQTHQDLYSKIIEVGNSKLSEYVIHRKLVLDLFEKFLKTKAPEKAVHSLVFPLHTLSDEIGFEDHNLWMIDEKLSYHKYLASDKKFIKIKPL